MAASDKPSTSSTGPSDCTWRDQGDGQSTERRRKNRTDRRKRKQDGNSTDRRKQDGNTTDRRKRKRKREETDMNEDTKGSRVTSELSSQTTEDCSYCNMDRLVACGQYQEALAYIRTNRDVSSVSSSKAELQRYLQKIMISLITDKGLSSESLGLDYADVMVYLLSERLGDYNVDDDVIYLDFFGAFLISEYKLSLLKLVNKHATNLRDKRRLWRIMFRAMENIITIFLHSIHDSTQPDNVQKFKNTFAILVQLLPAFLHDDSDPDVSLSWLHNNSATTTIVDYIPKFTIAVELRLVREAKLLYEAGAVSKAELTDVANIVDVQNMLTDEKDQSKMAVFLRKVLKQPRRLESLALLRVSRLVGQEVLGMESRVRQLPLASTLRDTILLHPQFNRYRTEIECKDQSTDGGV